jgi:hypothetical protein
LRRVRDFYPAAVCFSFRGCKVLLLFYFDGSCEKAGDADDEENPDSRHSTHNVVVDCYNSEVIYSKKIAGISRKPT